MRESITDTRIVPLLARTIWEMSFGKEPARFRPEALEADAAARIDAERRAAGRAGTPPGGLQRPPYRADDPERHRTSPGAAASGP